MEINKTYGSIIVLIIYALGSKRGECLVGMIGDDDGFGSAGWYFDVLQ